MWVYILRLYFNVYSIWYVNKGKHKLSSVAYFHTPQVTVSMKQPSSQNMNLLSFNVKFPTISSINMPIAKLKHKCVCVCCVFTWECSQPAGTSGRQREHWVWSPAPPGNLSVGSHGSSLEHLEHTFTPYSQHHTLVCCFYTSFTIFDSEILHTFLH